MEKIKQELLNRQLELDTLYCERTKKLLKEDKINYGDLTNNENLRKQNITNIFNTNVYMSEKSFEIEKK